MMGVLSSMSAQRRVLLDYRTPSTWQTFLARELRQDLAHGEQLSYRPGEIRLTGYGATDRVSGEPLHRPAEITYLIRRIGNRSCLLRAERLTTDPLTTATRVELVCVGVSLLEIQPLQSSKEELDWAELGLEVESPRSETEDITRGFEMAVPSRLRIVVGTDEKSKPVFDEVLSSR